MMKPEAPVRDPFDRRNYPGPIWPIVLPDLDQETGFTTRRGRNLGIVGHGATELEAILNLEKREPQC